jgi:hypothetical protein
VPIGLGVELFGTIIGSTAAAASSVTGPSNTSGSATFSSPTFTNNVAATVNATQDAMVYLTVTTTGTAFTVNIGPTSGVANQIVASTPVTAGEIMSVRVPAGWFFRWAGTTVTVATTAVTC